MSIGQMRVVDSYDLSSTQEGMVFHGLSGAGTGVDLEQIVCSIRGHFDEAAFVAAFQEVMSRHAVLRTRFSYDGDGRPLQEVLESAEIPVVRFDLSGVESAEQPDRLAETLDSDRARGIDLAHAPAMRLLFVRLSEDEHRVVWTFHHALLDGRSFVVVLREVFALYGRARQERSSIYPCLVPYRDYIEFLRSLDLESAERYWRGRLSGITAPTPLSSTEQCRRRASGRDTGSVRAAAAG
jgi:hypothetical protein